MHADALRVNRQRIAADRGDLTIDKDPGDMREASLGTMDHGLGMAARDQRSVIEIGTVGKNFFHHAKSSIAPSHYKL